MSNLTNEELDQLEKRLQAINAYVFDNSYDYTSRIEPLTTLIIASHRAVIKQNEQMKQALEWYASECNYQSSPIEDGIGWHQPEVMNDAGEIAREALKEGAQ